MSSRSRQTRIGKAYVEHKSPDTNYKNKHSQTRAAKQTCPLLLPLFFFDSTWLTTTLAKSQGSSLPRTALKRRGEITTKTTTRTINTKCKIAQRQCDTNQVKRENATWTCAIRVLHLYKKYMYALDSLSPASPYKLTTRCWRARHRPLRGQLETRVG